jgi:hypothetical protein
MRLLFYMVCNPYYQILVSKYVDSLLMHVPVGDLKGTDPMAYTANALSFILENLGYKYKYHHAFQIFIVL